MLLLLRWLGLWLLALLDGGTLLLVDELSLGSSKSALHISSTSILVRRNKSTADHGLIRQLLIGRHSETLWYIWTNPVPLLHTTASTMHLDWNSSHFLSRSQAQSTKTRWLLLYGLLTLIDEIMATWLAWIVLLTQVRSFKEWLELV